VSFGFRGGSSVIVAVGGFVGILVGGVVGGGFFLFHGEFGLLFHDVIARAGDMDGGIFRVAFAFDGVAAFCLDGDFAFGFLFGDFARGMAAAVVPGD